jgi:hypothetical protein
MAELVTSSAASQLNLLAHRQQDFSAERNPAVEQAASAATQAPPAVAKPVRSDASNLSDERPARERQQPERRPPVEVERAPVAGPSKPRIELKHIDFGLTPSEVVGTVDVLQRFDDNGDGRVNLLESQQAQLSRSDGATFEGLAAATVTSEAPTQHALGNEPSTAPAPDQQAAAGQFIASPGQPSGHEPAIQVDKKFYGDKETASLGAPTGTEDAPQKFYGQGAEVVIGQFAAAAEAAPKYYDKAPDARSEGAVAEEGTGETKYYDKVAQTETDQSFGNAPGEGDRTYHEKAQQVASESRSGGENTGQKKYAHAELSVYSTTVDITGGGSPTAIPGATVITV